MIWLDSVNDTVSMNLGKLYETVEDTGAWCAVVHRVEKSQQQVIQAPCNIKNILHCTQVFVICLFPFQGHQIASVCFVCFVVQYQACKGNIIYVLQYSPKTIFNEQGCRYSSEPELNSFCVFSFHTICPNWLFVAHEMFLRE